MGRVILFVIVIGVIAGVVLSFVRRKRGGGDK
jgi:hypothetical protein